MGTTTLPRLPSANHAIQSLSNSLIGHIRWFVHPATTPPFSPGPTRPPTNQTPNSAIIQGDRSSAAYETQRNKDRLAFSQRVTEYERLAAQKPFLERARDWAGAHRYQIVVGSWAAAMAVALGLVRRNRFLTAQQKLVQARVYAQGLTVGVLLASFGLEARDAAGQKGRWETVRVLDPEDPEHRRLIEKRVHHERYEGEDQWIGEWDWVMLGGSG